MATIRFYLKNKKAEKESLIYLYFLSGKEQFKISTQKKIAPKDWDARNQQPRRTHSGFAELKIYLNNLASEVEKSFTRLQSLNTPFSLIDIKDKLSINLNLKAHEEDAGFFDFILEYTERSKTLKSSATIKAYTNTYNHLLAFQNATGRKITFDSINIKFYDDFIAHLIKTKNLGPNAIGNQIKNLKVFLNEATELGLNTKFDYKSRRFKKLENEADTIYLTVDEIQKLEEINFDENTRLGKVRDMFLIGCYTGLRFSDFSQLRKENISSEMIHVRTRKRDQVVMIPIHPMVARILEKFTVGKDIQLPKPISNQRMNQYLKEIGKEAKIKQQILITSRKGNKQERNAFPKHDLITTHTARRSFATNLYLQGFPSISIMKITGHKTEKAFLKYIKVSQEENAAKLKDFWDLNKK